MKNQKFKRKFVGNHMGASIELYTLRNSNELEVQIFNYGGRMNAIKVPSSRDKGKPIDIILGYPSIDGYLEDNNYMNALIGRVSNRIGPAQFKLNGHDYSLSVNEGENHLHGGFVGFESKIWKLVGHEENSDFVNLTLGLKSKNFEEGYPGELEIKVTYILDNYNNLTLEMKASSDRDTILSMTNHNYWNLNGHGQDYGDVSNHILRIPSRLVCETMTGNLPTGHLKDISATAFDFIHARELSKEIVQGEGIDLNYCFGNRRNVELAAEAYSPATGIGVTISSDLPGIQCYTGGGMSNQYMGKSGRTYGRGFGLCLEPQFYPNAIHQPHFPSPILKAGQPYAKIIRMDFRNDY